MTAPDVRTANEWQAIAALWKRRSLAQDRLLASYRSGSLRAPGTAIDTIENTTVSLIKLGEIK